MLILLPPSETKRPGGTGTFVPERLRNHDALGDARASVRAALEELSQDPVASAKALKLGVKNGAEREHNLVLRESGVLPAIERYTGVLYDALDAPSLDAPARAWLDSHVAVQSALFGLIGAGEGIPAYRLSAGSRLPALGTPLKRVWGSAHAALPWAEAGLVLDLRSQDYAALAPVPGDRSWFVHVAQRGEDGAVRALNHFNKAAKGDFVRRLARSQADFATVEDVVEWAREAGLELSRSADSHELTLITELGAPGAASARSAAAR